MSRWCSMLSCSRLSLDHPKSVVLITPKSSVSRWVFPYKPSNVGVTPMAWKPPYLDRFLGSPRGPACPVPEESMRHWTAADHVGKSVEEEAQHHWDSGLNLGKPWGRGLFFALTQDIYMKKIWKNVYKYLYLPILWIIIVIIIVVITIVIIILIIIVLTITIHHMNLPRCFVVFSSAVYPRLAMIRLVACTCLLVPAVEVFCRQMLLILHRWSWTQWSLDSCWCCCNKWFDSPSLKPWSHRWSGHV